MTELIKGSDQWKKKRGFYFGGLEKGLANKYNTSQIVIHTLRKDVIFHKKTYMDIFTFYALKVNRSLKEVNPPKDTLAIKVVEFLKIAKTEELDDITRLTKFDHDFIEDQKHAQE